MFLNLGFINKRTNGGVWITAFGLGLLKIYPIAITISLIQKTKVGLSWLWMTVVAEIAFFIVFRGDLRMVAQNTPQAAYGTYGYPVAFSFSDFISGRAPRRSGLRVWRFRSWRRSASWWWGSPGVTVMFWKD